MATSLQDDAYTFINHGITIWDRQDGHPTPTVPLSSSNYSHPERRIRPFVVPASSKSPASDKKLPNIITPFVLSLPLTQAAHGKSVLVSHAPPANFTLPAAGKFNGQLLGRYEWPFSFHFPTEVDMSYRKSEGPAILTPAPQSIQGHGANVTIKYYLTLKISHGKFRKASR